MSDWRGEWRILVWRWRRIAWCGGAVLLRSVYDSGRYQWSGCVEAINIIIQEGMNQVMTETRTVFVS